MVGGRCLVFPRDVLANDQDAVVRREAIGRVGRAREKLPVSPWSDLRVPPRKDC